MQIIIQLAKDLAEIRNEISLIEDSVKPLKAKRDEIQSQLIEAMKESELKSIKTDDYNFARTIKKDFRVVDEFQLVADLVKRGEYGNYFKAKLDVLALKSFQTSLLRGTGEILNGVEPTEIEYMSIKSLKPKI